MKADGKNMNQPHGAWLKNGNPACNLAEIPKCTAYARSANRRCRQPAMKNGKCRFHGGVSTGPRTAQGKINSREANRKHGRYSEKEVQDRLAVRWVRRNLADLCDAIDKL